jgi:predicted dienelactone hydrolase
MKPLARVGVLIFLCISFCVNTWASSIDSKAGVFEDASRSGRKVPYKILYPKPLDASCPIIILSHGLGGSLESNEVLGRHLANHGFVVVHIQHEGSDEALYKGLRDRRAVQVAMQRSLMLPANAANRFLDLPFVVRQLAALNESDKELKGHLNLEALGMAGHSYGAISTMVAAGERVGARSQSVKVPSLRAGLLMSPSPPRDGADIEHTYADVTIPLFHITGTNDVSLVDARIANPQDRTQPYRSLNIANQYLLVLNKADHLTFSDRHMESRDSALDKKHMAAVLNGALAFFQAYLLDDKKAEAWLRTDYKSTLDASDVFQFK